MRAMEIKREERIIVKIKISWILVIILILGIGYYLACMFYYLNNPFLGYKGGFSSKSLAESKRDEMYIGEYKTDKNFVKLKDGSILGVKNAWIEHQFKYKKNFLFFIHSKQKTNGFYIVVPPLEGRSELRKSYALDLHKEDEKYTSSPGIGFSNPLGYQVYLNEIPTKIRFNVIQKENDNDVWQNAEVVDTITYTKSF